MGQADVCEGVREGISVRAEEGFALVLGIRVQTSEVFNRSSTEGGLLLRGSMWCSCIITGL